MIRKRVRESERWARQNAEARAVPVRKEKPVLVAGQASETRRRSVVVRAVTGRELCRELGMETEDVAWFWSQVCQAALAYGRYGTRERVRQAMERIALSGLRTETLAAASLDRAMRHELARHVMATWNVGTHAPGCECARL